MTLDGYVAGANDKLDWMTFENDEKSTERINELTDTSDTILLGRKMTDGFIKYWTSVLDNPESSEYEFAKKMVETPKVVFSKTIKTSGWANTTLANGNLIEEINNLKQKSGKDILVYGGVRFVSSLIDHNLIDEYNFFINPTAIGIGRKVFGDTDRRFRLELVRTEAYSNSEVLLTYKPRT